MLIWYDCRSLQPLAALSLSPFLEHPEKPADILDRLPRFLVGNRLPNSVLEYPVRLLYECRTDLFHAALPRKKTP
jgi:hypothetical protein